MPISRPRSRSTRSSTPCTPSVTSPTTSTCRSVPWCVTCSAKWATEGSGGLLELGPHMVERLHAITATAEEAGTDDARLAAYEQLRQLLGWLKLPLDNPEIY